MRDLTGVVPFLCFFFFSSRRRHTRCSRDWSSDVCSSDLASVRFPPPPAVEHGELGLVSRRERHAVEQLAPEHAERLPVFLELDQHAVAHRRWAVGRGREEVYRPVARPRPASRRGTRRSGALPEHDEPLKIEDVPGNLRLFGAAGRRRLRGRRVAPRSLTRVADRSDGGRQLRRSDRGATRRPRDRKSTRLNSSHGYISYAVFCLKKKNKDTT